jgi:hypothetical protein
LRVRGRARRSIEGATPAHPQPASPTQSEDNRSDNTWRPTLADVASAVTIAGIVVYGLLSVTYDRFYRALGIAPSDVGLTYGTTLANSVGMILLLAVLLLIFITTGHLRTASNWGYHRGAKSRTDRGQKRWRRYWAYLIATAEVVALSVGLYWGLDLATSFGTDAANTVKLGRPVVVPYLGPTTLLAIHADPAVIKSALRPGENPTVDSLDGQPLLFLGQANGNTVLYDSDTQSSIFLPTSSVILRVSNCATHRSPNPLCERALRDNFLRTRNP